MQIYKRGASGIYQGRFRYKKKHHRKSLGTRNKQLAQELAAEWEKQVIAAEWGKRGRITFDDAVRDFLKFRMGTFKPRSADRYETSMKSLLPSFEGVYLDRITSASLTEFEKRRRDEGVSDSTIIKDINCLASIFTLANDLETFDGNPARQFRQRRVKSKGLVESAPRERYASHEEELTILKALMTHGKITKGEKQANYLEHTRMMYAAAMIIAVDTGLRREELFALPWRLVDLNAQEITVAAESAKSGFARRLPILPRSLHILQRLPRGSSEHVLWHPQWRGAIEGRYTDMPKRFKSICAGIGITDFTWHDLRRTCGCRLLQDRGLSMDRVSAWLGHSSIKVTEKSYAFLNVSHLHADVGTGEKKCSQIRSHDKLKTAGLALFRSDVLSKNN